MPSKSHSLSWNSVEDWVHTVATHNERSEKPVASSHHRMRLRSAATRQPLTHSSGNAQPPVRPFKHYLSPQLKPAQETKALQQSCKRKRAMDDDYGPNEVDEAAAKRGRPPKNPKRTASKSPSKKSIGSLSPVLMSLPHNPASTFKSSKTTSRLRSPKKKTAKTIDKPKANVAIDMKFSKTCRPSVTEMKELVAQETGGIPDKVLKLCSLFGSALDGFIPKELEVRSVIPKVWKCKANL